MSKCIKHAFKTYPKIRKGDFSELASNTVEAEAEVVQKIDYGISQEEAEFIHAEAQESSKETVVHVSDDLDDNF